MPIYRIRKGGRIYYRWGRHGHLYRTRAEALAQMRAAFAHGWRERARPQQHVRRLHSGRHTIVNRGVRKSYGSWLFRQQAKARIPHEIHNPGDQKKFFHFLEKNPELVEPLSTVARVEVKKLPISQWKQAGGLKGESLYGYYDEKDKSLALSRYLFQPYLWSQGGKHQGEKSFSDVGMPNPHEHIRRARNITQPHTQYQTVIHEMAHKRQDDEGRLTEPTYMESGKIDWTKHGQDPLEKEAIAAQHRAVPARLTTEKLTELNMRRLFR